MIYFIYYLLSMCLCLKYSASKKTKTRRRNTRARIVKIIGLIETGRKKKKKRNGICRKMVGVVHRGEVQ